MRKPGRGCTKPGCAGVVRDGFGRADGVCDVCGQGSADKQRGSAALRGYGRRWRALRLRVLRSDPLCVVCVEKGLIVAATDVDHIIAKRDGGSDHLSNLQALCHACHSRKTQSGG